MPINAKYSWVFILRFTTHIVVPQHEHFLRPIDESNLGDENPWVSSHPIIASFARLLLG
jgi:hypothetical protein